MAAIAKSKKKGSFGIEFGEGREVDVPIEDKRIVYFFFKNADNALNNAETATIIFSEARPLLDFFNMPVADYAELFEVNKITFSRWQQKPSKELNKFQSKLLLDLDAIIAKGVKLFGSKERVLEWFRTKNNALGNKTPMELIKDPKGVEMVRSALDALSWGNVM